jgi:branched-chain amino acid transport system substrate-binding protein
MIKSKNKWVFALIMIILLAGIITYTNNPKQQKDEIIKIGAILPLTGATAQYGESLRDGMELAKEELEKKGLNLEIYYEDSAGDPKQAVSAYQNLKLKDTDIIVSALSRSSMALVPIANNDKIPLIMTVVSAKIEKTPYVLRFYPNDTGYADAHFSVINTTKYKKISVLYVNDEFGISLKDAIKRNAKEKGIQVVYEEDFEPGTKDYRTILLKVKETNPDAVMVVGASPAEIIGPLKTMKELELNADFFEIATALSIKSVRSQTDTEGAYTTAFPFVLSKSGNEFREQYTQKYGKEPFFAAPFGYDIVNLISQATKGKKVSGEELLNNIYGLKTFNSSNEEIQIKENGEINPALYSVKIVKGELEEVRA